MENNILVLKDIQVRDIDGTLEWYDGVHRYEQRGDFVHLYYKDNNLVVVLGHIQQIKRRMVDNE